MTIGTKVKVARESNKTTPPSGLDRIRLRHIPSGEVSAFFGIDCREILAAPDTEYEPADTEAIHALVEAKIMKEGQDANVRTSA